MRILFLSAANSIHTVKWVNALANRGYEIYLAYNAGHEPELDKILSTVHLRRLKYSGLKGYYLNAKQLRNIVDEIKPDVINVHYASGYGTLARRGKIGPILLSVWGSDVYDFPYKNLLNKKILQKNVKYATKIASTSQCMAEQLKDIVGNPDLEVAITPFGVDLDKFRPLRKKELDECITIGTIKALKPVYKIDDFIKAVSLLDMKDKIKVEIYGDGEQKEELEELIEKFSLENLVFLKGKIPNSDVPKALQKLDIFCAMSEKESFGVAIIEAMAMQVPVIVSDADGFKEVVIDGKTGFVVPKGDIKKMAERLEILISNKEIRESFGKAGRKHVEKLYDFEKNVTTMERLYNEMHNGGN